MVRYQVAVSLGLLLFSTAVLSEVTLDLNYDSDLVGKMSKKYDVKGNFELTCKVKATDKEVYSTKWQKNDKDVNTVEKLKDRLVESHDESGIKMRVTKATEDDAGMYQCVAFNKNGEFARENITLISRYRVKIPDNLNFVEGEALKITCAVYGKPTPIVTWQIGNVTYEKSSDRITLEKDMEKDVENATLIISEVTMDDRNIYTCIATPRDGSPIVSDEAQIRIKDKYAALWPFLGICAEVFILCAIILIYEKKRNKAELEESDTDQSPDQKNTPDHGKDSNLRHRN